MNLVGSIHQTATKLYSGSKKLHSTRSGNIRLIRRTLPLIGSEQSSAVDEEEIKIKMDDMLTCGRRSLVSGTQNEIVVS